MECRAWLGQDENWGLRKKPQSSRPFFARAFYFSQGQLAAMFCLLKSTTDKREHHHVKHLLWLGERISGLATSLKQV